jgi:hypothetical protein
VGVLDGQGWGEDGEVTTHLLRNGRWWPRGQSEEGVKLVIPTDDDVF